MEFFIEKSFEISANVASKECIECTAVNSSSNVLQIEVDLRSAKPRGPEAPVTVPLVPRGNLGIAVNESFHANLALKNLQRQRSCYQYE